jgi:hypothetical protein
MLSIVLADVRDIPEKNKLMLEKLNHENKSLLDKQKKVIKDHDDISANLLIQ